MDAGSSFSLVKEMILDEKKLVTYTSVSRELCIHVNESKRILNQVNKNIKETHPDIDLNVNYIISGLTSENKVLISVCPEKELANIRDNFKNIFFEHIYSLSKGLNITDHVASLGVSKFADLNLCRGLIKGDVCIKRSSDEIGKLKAASQEVLDSAQEKKTIPMKKKDDKKKETPISNGGVDKISEIKTESAAKLELSPPKKDLSSNNKSKSINKTQKGIAGFFTKTSNAPAQKANKENNIDNKTPIKTVIKIEKDEAKDKDEKMEIDDDNNMEVDENKIVNNKKECKSKSTTPKSTEYIKKSAKLQKKRKRVLQVSDSDSDTDPFASEQTTNDRESDEEIPPTPTVNTVKITSGINNPRKIRKIVDKTYMDEDGYVLTKKEVVYENCSDTEPEVKTETPMSNEEKVEEEKHSSVHSKKKQNGSKNEEATSEKSIKNGEQINEEKSSTKISQKKQNGTKNGKKKASPPQKGKQQTMMNFFKKL